MTEGDLDALFRSAPRRLGQSRFFRHMARRYARSPSAVIIRTAEAELLSRAPMAPPVLDMCCGDGFFGGLVRPSGFDAGCDISASALRRAARTGLYGKLAEADISRRIPFEDDSFRSILCNSAIEHVQDLNGALRETARVLAPGGRAYFTLAGDHAYRWWPCGAEALRRYREYQPVHNVLSAEAWKERLEAAGLRCAAQVHYLPRRTCRLAMFLDYHVSATCMSGAGSPLAPLVCAVRRLPPPLAARLWRLLFSGLGLTARGSGGGLLMAVERESPAQERRRAPKRQIEPWRGRRHE